jgi:hypothetical protein
MGSPLKKDLEKCLHYSITMKILFVSGFNTHPEEREGFKIYVPFELYYRNSPDKLEFFRYKTYEKGEDVLFRLKTQIHTKEYDAIIAHSTGGAFLYRLLNDEQISPVLRKMKRIILLMPLLCADPTVNFLVNFTGLPDIPLPSAIFTPNSKLVSNELATTNTQLVIYKQIKYAYNNLLPTSSFDAVFTINSYPNLRVLFAANDTVATPLPKEYIQKIHKGQAFILKNGLHEGFRSPDTQDKFFDLFERMFE